MSEDSKIVYQIFGRTAYALPLEYVQSVEVADANELQMPEGENWVELIAFPKSAAIQVIPHSEETIL